MRRPNVVGDRSYRRWRRRTLPQFNHGGIELAKAGGNLVLRPVKSGLVLGQCYMMLLKCHMMLVVLSSDVNP